MNNNQNMDIKNEEHIQEVYIDQAIFFLKFYIGISLFSIITYLIALEYNAFDFGFIFEVISFVFVILSMDKLKKHKLQSAKKCIIIAMIPIGWLIIYDFINLLANLDEVITNITKYYTTRDKYYYSLMPYLIDVTLIILIGLLYKSYSSVTQVNKTTKSDNYTDTFYNKL